MKFYQDDRYEYQYISICKQGHHGPDGQNITRLTKSGKKSGCFACKCGMEPGLFVEEFVNVKPFTGRKYDPFRTEEERKKLQSEASMRWNKRNKDKTKQYAKKYQSKPEVYEKIKEHAREHWKNMPPDKKKEKLEKQKVRSKQYYEENKEEILAVRKEKYKNRTEEQKALRLEKEREKYKNLTDEQKAKRREAQRKAYQKRKELKNVIDTGTNGNM